MTRKRDIKQIDKIVKKVKLSRGQRRILHQEISGQNLTLKDIRAIARDIKKLYPNK